MNTSLIPVFDLVNNLNRKTLNNYHMKVELKNVFDATLCDQEISINNEYDEYGYIFNYIWNKMLPHGRNMEEVKSEIEHLLNVLLY